MGKIKVKIDIDYTKCTQAQDCRKCVQECPTRVFIITFDDENYHDPKHWFIHPVFPQFCINCNLCVEICPKNAINLKVKKKYRKKIPIES